MKKLFILLLQYVIFFGAGIFLIWFTTKNLTPNEIANMKNAIKTANYFWVLPIVLILLLSHYSRALRWKLLLKPIGIIPSTANTFFSVMIGYFFNLLVPRLGEVMKCTLLAKYEKTPVDKLIGTIVAERAIDLLTLIFIILITIITQFSTIGTFALDLLHNFFNSKSGSFDVMKFLVLITSIALFIFTIRFAFFRFAEVKIIRTISSTFKRILEGVTSIKNVENIPAFIFHSIFIWGMYLLSIRIGFYAMAPVAHLGMPPALSILSIGSLAMIVTQGGIGAYQLAVQNCLELYKIFSADGLAFGWLIWLSQTLMVLITGLICLILLPIYNNKKNEKHKSIG
jgi:uncharacterized protein (TIRG00374 family)